MAFKKPGPAARYKPKCRNCLWRRRPDQRNAAPRSGSEPGEDMSRFFIDRPIFANVIAIVTIILGIVALRVLPVEQYPAITPPTVRVTTVYPGANAQVVADTVAVPIEQQVNGVERMLYMSSTSSSDGS